MKCRDARRLIVRRLVEGEDVPPGPELAVHLGRCPRCARRLSECRTARNALRAMPPVDLPDQLDTIMAEGIRDALASPMRLDNPPADPTPEMPGQKKGAIVLLALVVLLVAAVALVSLFAGEPASQPPGPAVALAVGDVYVSPPGSRGARPVAAREALPPGSEIRTGPEALAQVQDGPVLWSLPSVSRMAFGADHRAELVAGRAYAECAGGEAAPCELLTPDGTVRCSQGSFVALRTLKRLKVGCTAGSVVAGEGEHALALQTGQVVVLAEGTPCGPVRTGRASELADFMRLLTSYDGRRLSPRQLAAAPLPPDEPALPPSIAMSALSVRVTMRGPIAVVEAEMALRNSGAEAWRGAVRLGDALLPPPLSEAPAGDVSLAPGGEGTFRAAALCTLRGRDGCYAVGLLPAAWTGAAIGRLFVQVEASADGGIRRFQCPTLGEPLRKPGTVSWSWQGDRVAASTPIVVECELADREGADSLALRSDEGTDVLTAWRSRSGREEWIRKGRNVFFAFDAAGDFGPGGMAAAQDVLEVLLDALPPACSTALLAYDGGLKFGSDRLAPHLPERVESMLMLLWALRDGGEPRLAYFLDQAIAGAGAVQGENLLIFVTGRQAPAALSDCEAALRASGICLSIIQVGAERPSAVYSRLAADSGGVALAVPPGRPAELGAYDFLIGLRSPSVGALRFEPAGAGQATVLRGPGDFADQPAVVLTVLPANASGVRARVTTRCGADERTREFAFEIRPGECVTGETAAALSRGLARMVEDVCIVQAGSDRIP